ncbi:MAG TPA: PAS domain-containing protein, partial [Flavitalea sp.]|nr:PAS domain-containing protein [Flavitalea sp.]
TWMGESVLVSRSGKITSVMMILIVHRDKDGKFSYLSLVAYDLSEIKQKETALRESEKRWQFAVHGSNLGLWDWNINLNRTFYSNRWKSMLGHEDNEIGNEPIEFEKRLHPEDRERVLEELNDYFTGKSADYNCVLRLRKKDGSYIYVRDRGMITDYNPDGTPSRMIGTHSDITHEHDQADRLRRSREELRLLAGHLQNLREEERLNVSRIMQEDVGQQLSSLKMTFSTFDSPDRLPAADVKTKVTKAQLTLENAITVLQQISTELRPTIIEDLGLVASLQALTTEFQSRFNIRIRFSSLLENIETTGKVALCIYRVYQEALSNIAHHSRATMVAVRLTLSEDGRLILAIKDNGVGFDVKDRQFLKNFGLVEVRERMLMIDGGMEIHSAPGSGTVLKVSAPLMLQP